MPERQLGFTLIEIMVVMVILGFATSMAVMSFGTGKQERELQNEVNRLHAVLRLAAEEAIFTNEEIGVVIEEDHYEFLISDENRTWGSIENNTSLRRYPLPEWLSLDFQREGEKRELVKRAQVEEFDGESNILDNEKVGKKPSIILFSSGEVTGFLIGMQIKDDADSRVEIRRNDQDEIILPAQEERENAL